MIEELIFSNLLYNEEYSRKVIPFLKDEYFKEKNHKVLFSIIDEYVKKYNMFPSKEAIFVDLSNKNDLDEPMFNSVKEYVSEIEQPMEKNTKWAIDQTETFCQDKAIYNAILESLDIIEDGPRSTKSKTIIPHILSDALGVSFDSHIGIDFLEDSNKLYEFYHSDVSRIPFDLYWFNKITNGGVTDKSLNVIMAKSGLGKSTFLCHFAADNLMQGKNVLYITLEMSEERIAERIYANLLDTPISDLSVLSKDIYDLKVAKLRNKTKGKLFIKEYPTASASAAHFRYLINELKIKKGFVPDVIYIDYLNICASSRFKGQANQNSYTIVKSIAEEIRGLGVEFGVPIWSATQTNREGFNNSDPDERNISESIGLIATCDLFLVLITSEELEKLGQIQVKQLKNRYNDIIQNRRFVVGVDRAKMRVYDVEQEASDNYADPPIMDTTTFGMQDAERKAKKFSSFI